MCCGYYPVLKGSPPAGTAVAANKTGSKMKCVGVLLLIVMLSAAMAAPWGEYSNRMPDWERVAMANVALPMQILYHLNRLIVLSSHISSHNCCRVCIVARCYVSVTRYNSCLCKN